MVERAGQRRAAAIYPGTRRHRRHVVGVTALLVAASTAAAPSGANAQLAGSRLTREAEQRDAPTLVRELTQCVVYRQEQQARALMATLPGSSAETALLAQLNDALPRCLGTHRLWVGGQKLTLSRNLLRGAIAEQLLGSRYAPLPEALPANAGEVSPYARMTAEQAKEADRTAVIMQDFAHCVVRHHWPHARAFLAAPVKSGKAKAALAALSPALGPCLPQSVQLAIDPAVLRGALAEQAIHAFANGQPTMLASAPVTQEERQLAACLRNYAEGEVTRFLEATAGSEAEAESLEALASLNSRACAARIGSVPVEAARLRAALNPQP